MKKIYLKCEPKNGRGGKIWNIEQIQNSLGTYICNVILFVHAFLGCDTTSKPFGKGKNVTLKLSSTNDVFKSLAQLFYKSNCSQNEIDVAGERAMIIVYSGLPTDNLDNLRYQNFKAKVLTASLTTSVNPKSLPPTSAAMKFHSRRTYLQVNYLKKYPLKLCTN